MSNKTEGRKKIANSQLGSQSVSPINYIYISLPLNSHHPPTAKVPDVHGARRHKGGGALYNFTRRVKTSCTARAVVHDHYGSSTAA